MIQCSSSSPSAPTATLAVSTVTLTATSIAAGTNTQGTVTLTAAAPTGGTSISLTSSSVSVATVQTPVTVPAGSSTIPFTVVGVAAGTTTITAAINGVGKQSPTLSVTATSVALASLTLNASTVVGGDQVNGTVTLTGPAPAGGAVVVLAGSDPLIAPANVTVPAGSSSMTFTMFTRVVGGTIAGTLTATYGASSTSAMISVTKSLVATASFGVTGPDTTETCTMTNGGNTLNCTFDGSTSTAPGTITQWEWLYAVAKTFGQTTSTPRLSMPTVDCSLLPPPPLPAGEPWFMMTVTLRVHDNLGNVSAETIDRGVRVLPQGVCGF